MGNFNIFTALLKIKNVFFEKMMSVMIMMMMMMIIFIIIMVMMRMVMIMSIMVQVTPDSLASMKERISKAAELILPGVRSIAITYFIIIIIIVIVTHMIIFRLDMLGYGCTSASAVLGEEVVFSQLASRYYYHDDH